ncbi:MAG: FecR domain-containing protein [Proteobacteria bacterium]|nr:FecR domain-containing protein [Pseudomonadota bacterium]
MLVAFGSRIVPPGIGRVAGAVACLLMLAAAGAHAGEADAVAPGRDSRISELAGTVSVHVPGQTTQWGVAVVDRVMASGEGLWTQPGGRARLALGGAAVELQEQTQLELANLTGLDTELRLVQGAIGVTVPRLGPGESYQVDTPRGILRIMLAGRFEIEAGAGERPTKVTVHSGAAQMVGTESGLIVTAGQTGVVTGVDGGLSYAVQLAALPGSDRALATEPAEAVPSTEAAPDAAPINAE